jgi:adenylyl cyclase-associated protein
MSNQLKPLGSVLDNVIHRLAAIEAQLGITSSMSTAPSDSPAATVIEEELHPSLSAFDQHVQSALVPFTASCSALGPEMESISLGITEVWGGMRGLVELGTIYKRPMGDVPTALQPHLKPCQDAITKVNSARLDRKYDWHIKAVKEMLSCVSWVVISPPPSPANFVKDTVGGTDFWANKIRKEYKTNEAEGHLHVKFCDAMKALVNDLSAYLKEHHLSGLGWNPHGKDFSEAKVGEVSSGAKPTSAAAPSKPAAAAAGAGIFDELKKKQTGDGSSAATGLKKVTRDQQTWRQEYKKPEGEVKQQSAPVASASKPAAREEKPLGPPKCEYQERGCKWSVENQTKESCQGGVCKVEVTDAKQQVRKYSHCFLAL